MSDSKTFGQDWKDVDLNGFEFLVRGETAAVGDDATEHCICLMFDVFHVLKEVEFVIEGDGKAGHRSRSERKISSIGEFDRRIRARSRR